MNNTRSLSFGVAIFFYPLTIVPKQKRAAEKPRETTVESVDIVPSKLHTHTASITLVARIRMNSLRTVDKMDEEDLSVCDDRYARFLEMLAEEYQNERACWRATLRENKVKFHNRIPDTLACL